MEVHFIMNSAQWGKPKYCKKLEATIGIRFLLLTSAKLLTPLIEEIEKERQPNSGVESLKAASLKSY